MTAAPAGGPSARREDKAPILNTGKSFHSVSSGRESASKSQAEAAAAAPSWNSLPESLANVLESLDDTDMLSDDSFSKENSPAATSAALPTTTASKPPSTAPPPSKQPSASSFFNAFNLASKSSSGAQQTSFGSHNIFKPKTVTPAPAKPSLPLPADVRRVATAPAAPPMNPVIEATPSTAQPRPSESRSTKQQQPTIRTPSANSISIRAEQPQPPRSPQRQKSKSGVEAIFSGLSALQEEKRVKDLELENLRQRLGASEKLLEASAREKDKMKQFMMTQVSTKLSQLATLQDDYSKLKHELLDRQRKSANVDLTEISEETKRLSETVKEALTSLPSGIVKKDDRIICEGNENSKLECLRELQTQLDKDQSVIAYLREQLETAKGELAESRTRLMEADFRYNELTNRMTRIIDQVAQADQARTAQADHAASLAARLEDLLDHQLGLVAQLEETKASARKREGELVEQHASEIKQLEHSHERDLSQADDGLQEKQAEWRESLKALQDDLAESERQVKQAEVRLAEATVNSTRREASQAEQYQRQISEATRDWSERMRNADEQRESVQRQLEHAQVVIASQKQELQAMQELGVRLEQAECKLKETESELAQQSQKLARVQGELEKERQAHGLVEAERMAELKQQIHSLEAAQRASDKKHAVELESVRAEAALVQSDLEMLLQQRVESIQSLESQVESLQDHVRISEQQHVVDENERDLALGEVSVLKKQIEESEQRRSALQLALDRAEEEKNQAVTKASNELYASIQNSFKTDLANKANELKRANNKVGEIQKRLDKALAELAKAKGAPVIDPHVASSSPASVITQLAAAAGQAETAESQRAAQDPPARLSVIGSNDSDEAPVTNDISQEIETQTIIKKPENVLKRRRSAAPRVVSDAIEEDEDHGHKKREVDLTRDDSIQPPSSPKGKGRSSRTYTTKRSKR